MHEINAQRVPHDGHVATQYYTVITSMPSLHTSLPVANPGATAGTRLAATTLLAATGCYWPRLAATGRDWPLVAATGRDWPLLGK